MQSSSQEGDVIDLLKHLTRQDVIDLLKHLEGFKRKLRKLLDRDSAGK